MNSRVRPLREVLDRKILAWMTCVAGFSMLLALTIALINLRISTESSVSLEMKAITKAFRSEILGGEVRNAEIQIRNLLSLKKDDRIQVLDTSLHPLFENTFERHVWPVSLKKKEIVWPSLFRLNLIVPIYYDQDHEHLFGYLALDHSPYFHWTLFYLIFGSLMSAQAIFFFVYRKGVLSIGQHLSAQLNLVESGLRDRTTNVGIEEKLRIVEVEAVHNAFRQIQSQIKSLQKTGAQSKSLQQVAHDIRSPLTALSIGLKTLREVPPATRNLLETAFARVESIANDILSSERREFLKTNPKTHMSQASILQVNNSINQLIEEKKIEYQGKTINWIQDFALEDSHQVINVELSGLLRCVSNILNNAIEVSPGEGYISVQTNLSNHRLNIAVSDQGPGIPEHLVSLILQGRRTSKSAGHGLGVSGTKSFVESNGGIFDLDSSALGLTVRLNFPVIQNTSIGAV